MSAYPPADDICAGYEALRAQAVGGRPSDSPRGQALVLNQGLPAWIRAWAAPPAVDLPPAPAGPTAAPGGLGAEVVRLLTEMALGGRARLAIP
jgi:hypothetical protein